MAVATYRNAESKEQKREMERLIGEIKTNFHTEMSLRDPKIKRLNGLRGEVLSLRNQVQLFELSKKEVVERDKRIAKLLVEIETLEVEIEAIRSNKIYENAFEWRFEFPEVLNSDGDFIGFDVVIGNPPYIRQEEFSAIKPYLKSRFAIYHSIADILTYFVELSYKLLKPQGSFQFIISNKFTRANYGQVMRQYLLNNTRLTHFIDFSGVAVFDEATVDAAIIGFEKRTANQNSFIYANISKQSLDMQQFDSCLHAIQTKFPQQHLTSNTWAFESLQVLAIKYKVEAQGIPLQDWNITINYGIKTGLDEAFVIDGKKKAELIAKDPASAKIIKPLLRGRDIHKWHTEYKDLWLIYIPKGHSIKTILKLNGNIQYDGAWNWFKQTFPFIAEHLQTFKIIAEKRTDKGDYWWEQRACGYLQDFEKPKIIYPNMTKFLPFVIDYSNMFTNAKCFILTGEKLEYLCSFFNSKLFKFCFKDNFPELLGGTRELSKVFFDKIPVKQINAPTELLFKALVLKIIALKQQAATADISTLESTIDQLVYQLYDLTPEEIAIIENNT